MGSQKRCGGHQQPGRHHEDRTPGVDEQEKRIYNNEYVQVIRPDQIIFGEGFESDASLQNWRIRNPRGTIYVRLNREGAVGADSLSGGVPAMQPVQIGNP